MDEQAIALISEKIVSDVSFWTALIGFMGVFLGALITGIFSFFQNQQSIKSAKLEKKKELLLMKYEQMYLDLDNYLQYVNEISVLSISSIDSGLNIRELKTDLKQNNFIMYSMLYTPSLSSHTEALREQIGRVIKPLSTLISSGTREEKEDLIAQIVTASLDLQLKVQSIKQELSTLTTELIDA
jgi:flagellar basal body-associated protein FliL